MTETATAEAALRRLKRVALYVLVAAVIIAAWGIFTRVQTRAALKQDAQQSALPVVIVTTPKHSDVGDELVLPGDVQAYIDAPIYARTNGYLKRWYADIGKHVKAGELLAEIETPEVDAQYRQAKADLATADANNRLSQTTAAALSAAAQDRPGRAAGCGQRGRRCRVPRRPRPSRRGRTCSAWSSCRASIASPRHSRAS